MSNPKGEVQIVRPAYPDGGEFIDLDHALPDQSGVEPYKVILGGIVAAMNQSIYERANADPELLAVKAELAKTPWYRFTKRRELSDRASKLGADALGRAVTGMVDSLGIEAIENDPDAET